MDMVVNHPRPGEESHDSWLAEREAVLSSLASRARLVASVLNTIPGISCNTVQGAMYAFPQIKIPQKVIVTFKKFIRNIYCVAQFYTWPCMYY